MNKDIIIEKIVRRVIKRLNAANKSIAIDGKATKKFVDEIACYEYTLFTQENFMVAVFRSKTNGNIITLGCSKRAPNDIANNDVGETIAVTRAIENFFERILKC